MAGSLIKIAETTVSSAVASVTLTGIDSTYDVYEVVANNVTPDTDSQNFRFRVTESGTPNTTANYDYVHKFLTTGGGFGNTADTNQTSIRFVSTGTATGEQTNQVVYIFCANDSSENTFFTQEQSQLNETSTLTGVQGGGVFTSTSTVNGLSFFFESGNIASGTFKLYGLKK
jgi:hypothetical protein